jgi:hypothetical protein
VKHYFAISPCAFLVYRGSIEGNLACPDPKEKHKPQYVNETDFKITYTYSVVWQKVSLSFLPFLFILS